MTLDREQARDYATDQASYLGKCLLNFDTQNGTWFVSPNREAGEPYVSGGYVAQAEVIATHTDNNQVKNTTVIFKIAPDETRIAISEELKRKGISIWGISQASCSAFRATHAPARGTP
jgi:hypothetical protein